MIGITSVSVIFQLKTLWSIGLITISHSSSSAMPASAYVDGSFANTASKSFSAATGTEPFKVVIAVAKRFNTAEDVSDLIAVQEIRFTSISRLP